MERSRQIIRVSVVGILANLVLVAFKAFVGFVSGSIAVILDAVNNLSDVLSSVITILGTKLAGKAPDKKHPYGHGRIENISSMTIAVIVLLAGLASFRESVDKILHPEAADYSVVSLIIIAAAVVVKLLLGRYVKAQGEKLKSESLVASGADALFDAVISLSTLAAAAVSLIWGLSVEGFLGVVISVVILKAGVEILLESLSGLIGQRVDSAFTDELKAAVCAFPEVLGAYDLILHQYGPETTIGSVHIEVDDNMTARELHHLTRRISEAVYRDFGVVLTVGIYASNTSDQGSAEMKAAIEAIVSEFPEILQVHGFYLEQQEKRATFDLIVDFGCDAEDVRRRVLEQAEQVYPGYRFDVVLDSDFSE